MERVESEAELAAPTRQLLAALRTERTQRMDGIWLGSRRLLTALRREREAWMAGLPADGT